MTQGFDIVTVGSAVYDVFVQTDPKGRKIEKNDGHEDVCMHVGSKILIQNLHFDTGGGGTNSAAAFARLGFKTGYVGKLGHDKNSDYILDALKKEEVDFLGKRTLGRAGYSVVLVGLHHDRTIMTYKGLNNSLEWDDINKDALKAKRFYFSSMMGPSFDTLQKIAKHATKNNIPYTFNPSSYQARMGTWKLRHLLRGCEILALNKEEAESMLSLHPQNPITDTIRRLKKYVSIAVITDGQNGAYAADGAHLYYIAARQGIKVVETTGAGDAFAAGFTAGRMWHMSVDDCLKLGMAEAESVIAHIGAKNILLSKKSLLANIHGKFKVHMEKL